MIVSGTDLIIRKISGTIAIADRRTGIVVVIAVTDGRAVVVIAVSDSRAVVVVLIAITDGRAVVVVITDRRTGIVSGL